MTTLDEDIKRLIKEYVNELLTKQIDTPQPSQLAEVFTIRTPMRGVNASVGPDSGPRFVELPVGQYILVNVFEHASCEVVHISSIDGTVYPPIVSKTAAHGLTPIGQAIFGDV